MNQMLGALVLVALAIVLGEVRKLGLTKDLLVGTLRSFVQLMAVGYVIKFVFDMRGLPYQSLLLLAMVLVGAHTARGRAKGMPRSFTISFVSILMGLWITLGVMILLGLIDQSPRFLIPLGGMIIGNSMNATSLSLERLNSEMKTRKMEIEAALALGLPPEKATEGILRRSVHSALIPLMNTMKIVGLIQLPGAMVGMLLAGASPLEAARLQLMVIYMLAASNTISVTTSSLFSCRVLFTKSAQLIENL